MVNQVSGLYKISELAETVARVANEKFGRSWCPLCKMVEQVLDKLEKEYMGRVKIGKLNVDRNPVTASKYHIKGVPTFIIFQKRKEIEREVGAKSEGQLRELINTALENIRHKASSKVSNY